MSWDHMAWQLELERLIAEANVAASEAARHLISDNRAEAWAWANKWDGLQGQINSHMTSAEKLRGGGLNG
jgi:hypothetical protein